MMNEKEISLIGSTAISYDNNDIYIGEIENITVQDSNGNRNINIRINNYKSFKDIILDESYSERRNNNIKNIYKDKIK